MTNISQEVNIEMLEKLADGTYRKKNPATKAEAVKLVDAQNKFTNKNVEGAMSELFTNVSSGKDLVGGAITGVDDSVVIPTDPTFGDLASAISGISTGKKWASGTVTVHSYYQTIEVTGLTFKPAIIIAYGNADIYVLYMEVLSSLKNDLMASTQRYDHPFSNFGGYVNNTGFKLRAGDTGSLWTWMAFE